MPKQWMYTLALLFVIFLVYSSPAAAGDAANGFASLIGTLVDGVVTFLVNLAGAGDDSAPEITSSSIEFNGLNPNDNFTQAN